MSTMSGATLVCKDAIDPLIHKSYLEELADAYLPVGLSPSRAAEALDRVMRGQTHIEPETAEALRTLVMLAGGLH